MTWTVSDIKSEVEAMAMLLKARPGVFELGTKLSAALLLKLQKMPALSACDLVSCYDAVKASDLPDFVRNEIIGALDARAMCSNEPNTVGKVTLMGQVCRTFQKYLTAKDLTQLQKCFYVGRLPYFGLQNENARHQGNEGKPQKDCLWSLGLGGV